MTGINLWLLVKCDMFMVPFDGVFACTDVWFSIIFTEVILMNML